MTHTLEVIQERKSIRAYEDKPISPQDKEKILHAAMRAPTAGNMMLYSIIQIEDQAIKDTLVRTCDNQPFIATAPWVLIFIADYQRWYDYYLYSDVDKICREEGSSMRIPEEGELLLACCDAMIAAQTAVIAAESLGIGSCYIGDIMENYETHRELFQLPRYTFPVGMLCFGYPTGAQKARVKTSRFGRDFIVFENCYQRLTDQEYEEMFSDMQEQRMTEQVLKSGIINLGELMYRRKLGAEFAHEMSRSVRSMLNVWTQDTRGSRA